MKLRMSVRTVAIILTFATIDGALAFWIGPWNLAVALLGIPLGMLLAEWDIRDNRRRRQQETETWWERWDQ